MPMSSNTETILCKHPSEVDAFYVDFSVELRKRTGVSLVSATVETTDALLVVSAASVSAGDITDEDCHGNAFSVAAGNAIQFQLSGGTSQSDDSEPLMVEVLATLSDGSTLHRGLLLRVK